MWKLFIQGSYGDVIFSRVYDSQAEMYSDAQVLMKPSMFGTDEFRFVMQRVSPDRP